MRRFWTKVRLPHVVGFAEVFKPPPLSLAVRTVNWGLRHMDRLEVYNQRLTILMPPNMVSLQNVVPDARRLEANLPDISA